MYSAAVIIGKKERRKERKRQGDQGLEGFFLSPNFDRLAVHYPAYYTTTFQGN